MLGRRYKMSGLEDILIEADVVAPGSINGVLSGHMYNRAIRSHKLLYEALSRMQLEHFLESLGTESATLYRSLIMEQKSRFQTKDVNFEALKDMKTEFCKFIKLNCASSPTYNFWNSYLDLVRLLLTFIRATRESDWLLHVHTLRLMLPWYFAYDRQNYAR